MTLHLRVNGYIGLAVLTLLAVGCADPADSVPAAKTSPTKVKKETAKVTKPAPKTDKTKPKLVESPGQKVTVPKQAADAGRALTGQIVFIGSKVTGSHECLFKTWTGTARIPGDDLTKASFSFAVETASVVVDYKNPKPWSKKLESHLKSHDFFHSQAAPKAEFVSSSVTKGGMNGTGTHVITGKMTIRGTTREISFPATMSLDGGTFKAQAEFSIRRKRFNIIYPGKPDDLIRDRVVLKLDFTG